MNTIRLTSGESLAFEEGGFYHDLVSYDVKSSDTLALLIMGFVVSVVIAVMGAWFGAWAGTRLFQEDHPIKVVIVEEAPEPTSQSGTDTHAP